MPLTYSTNYGTILEDKQQDIARLESQFDRIEKAAKTWFFVSLGCAGMGLTVPSWFELTPLNRAFCAGAFACVAASGYQSSKQWAKARKIEGLYYQEVVDFASFDQTNREATQAGYQSFLQQTLDAWHQPQEQQSSGMVMAPPSEDSEWRHEKVTIQAIFKTLGHPVSVREKTIKGDRIEFVIDPTPDVDEEKILERATINKIAYKLYFRGGYNKVCGQPYDVKDIEKIGPRIYAIGGRMILDVPNPFAKPMLNLQPLGTPVAVQEREPEYVQTQQPQPQSQAFSLNDGPSFTITRPDVSSIQMETIATSNQPESMFPTEDVAKAIAQTTANVNSASSIFILAPRGCGKTGLLQTAMWETWQLWQSKVDFFIWAGKDDEKYCGIESDPDRYIYSGDKNNAEESVTRLEDYCDRRTAKATGYPTIFVKDENNNTLRACAGFDRIDSVNPKFKAYARMSEADYAVITKGRSKLCLNWMTAHDPRKESTGQSTGVFANVYSVILGRTADGSPMYGMMQECLTGASSNGVVDDKEQRDKLYLQFQEYRRRLNEGKEDGNRVLCLTNVGGFWRLVLLPIYQKDIHTINYKDEAEDPYETFDEQFEDKFGVDPDEVFEEQDDTDDPWEDKLEGSDPYEAIINWIKSKHPEELSNPRFPDNNQLNELWQQWFKQQGRMIDPLNQNGLSNLREILNAKRGLS